MVLLAIAIAAIGIGIGIGTMVILLAPEEGLTIGRPPNHTQQVGAVPADPLVRRLPGADGEEHHRHGG